MQLTIHSQTRRIERTRINHINQLIIMYTKLQRHLILEHMNTLSLFRPLFQRAPMFLNTRHIKVNTYHTYHTRANINQFHTFLQQKHSYSWNKERKPYHQRASQTRSPTSNMNRKSWAKGIKSMKRFLKCPNQGLVSWTLVNQRLGSSN